MGLSVTGAEMNREREEDEPIMYPLTERARLSLSHCGKCVGGRKKKRSERWGRY